MADAGRVAGRVALGLGSGGARGYAHIGVARALAERDLQVVTVAGTSMGAMVGGMLAAGRLEEFADWACGLRQRDVLRMMVPRLGSAGMVDADRLLESLDDIFEDVNIEDLPIPFTAVATDLGSRREVWFQRGPLRAAVRASIAIPGVFTPVMLNGRVLVDGGLTNPIPLDPTVSVRSDLTVAVELTGPRAGDPGPQRQGSPVAGESAEQQRFEEWRHRLRRTLTVFSRADPEIDDLDESEVMAEFEQAAHTEHDVVGERTAWGTDPLPARLRMRDVTAQSFEAMQAVVGRFRMAAVPADVHIVVPVDACRSLDFHKAPEMIDLGHQLAIEALDAAGY